LLVNDNNVELNVSQDKKTITKLFTMA